MTERTGQRGGVFSPEHIAKLAEASAPRLTARGFPVEKYGEAIAELRRKGYSYAAVAALLNKWLAAALAGRLISRGQVYRVHRAQKENTP